MPELGGVELAQQLSASHFSAKFLLMSGYTDDALFMKVLNSGRPLLQKPFTPEVLLRRVREILDAS